MNSPTIAAPRPVRTPTAPTEQSSIRILYPVLDDNAAPQKHRYQRAGLMIVGVVASSWLVGAMFNYLKQPTVIPIARADYAQYQWIGYHRVAPSADTASSNYAKV